MENYKTQRSESWHKWREGKIGGSFSGACLGVSPYQTPLQLYNEMKGISPPKPMNWAMARGVALEDEALEWLIQETGIKFTPDCGEYSENTRIIASLDGLSECGTIIAEIKCSQKIYNEAKQGRISELYRAQLQHQMLVFGLDKNLFVAFDGFSGIIIEVERDDEFIADMLEKEIEFLNCLDTDTPPAHSDDDYVKVFVEDNYLIESYISIKEQIIHLSKLEKAQKATIEAMGDSGNLELCSMDGKPLLRLTRVQKEGSVDWKALCDDLEVDDEKIKSYRKPQIGYYRYSIVK